MKHSVLSVLTLLFAIGSASPLVANLKKANESYSIHAVLVAGSKGIENYRHQADVCHAYQVLRNHGVPSENIIVMMFDDIANNEDNPYTGRIYNIPNGPDVYAGVSKDYTGYEVTPENFLAVLKGEREHVGEGKKVLSSGPNDHVFVYFADHGAPGILGFPDRQLTAKDLNDALLEMHSKGLYGKLTFYVEACESGSMFDRILPKNLSIYATTSANDIESSYACFCNAPFPLDTVCLADEYSAAWLQDSDKSYLGNETLAQQFKNAYKNTPTSHPQKFGQRSIAQLDVGEFQGEKPSRSNQLFSPVPITGQVNSRDVPLHYLKRKISRSNNATHSAILKNKLANVLSARRFLDSAIHKIVSHLCSTGFCSNTNDVLASRRPLVDHANYSEVVKTFSSNCLNLGKHTYAMKYMYAFVNLVEQNQFDQLRLEKFLQQLIRTCSKHVVGHGFEAIV